MSDVLSGGGAVEGGWVCGWAGAEYYTLPRHQTFARRTRRASEGWGRCRLLAVTFSTVRFHGPCKSPAGRRSAIGWPPPPRARPEPAPLSGAACKAGPHFDYRKAMRHQLIA